MSFIDLSCLLATGEAMPLLVLVIGSLSVASLLLKQTFELFSLPPIVAYLLLGMLLAWLNRSFPVFDPEGQWETVLVFLSALGVVVLLFSIAPVLHDITASQNALTGQIWQTLGAEVSGFLLRFGLFAAAMLVFGRYLETPLDHCTRRIGNKATVLIFVVGLGLIIAAVAGLIRLSLPIGALFAGLLLSRHREDYGVEPFYRSPYLFLSRSS